jgi:pilus assembly protein CpaF
MNTGHPGSLTTLHAGDAREAITRLILMARFGMNLPPELIEEQIATALDLMVMSFRRSDGSRRIGAMSEVVRSENGRVQLVECVCFDHLSDSWTLVRVPSFAEGAIEAGIVSAEEVGRWEALIP